MRRIKINFNEKRELNVHKTNKSSALEWLNIWKADDIYFDSNRKYGYGGYKYDGRWKEIVEKLIIEFSLKKKSTLLDLGCAKGYLVNDYNYNKNVGAAAGVDISIYALIKGYKEKVRGELFCANFNKLPFDNNEFSLIFCKDSLHNILNKKEVIDSLREINRVGKDSWIRVGAYKTNKQKKIIDNWATFATTYLHVEEWLELFDRANYRGAYDWFHPSEEI